MTTDKFAFMIMATLVTATGLGYYLYETNKHHDNDYYDTNENDDQNDDNDDEDEILEDSEPVFTKTKINNKKSKTKRNKNQLSYTKRRR